MQKCNEKNYYHVTRIKLVILIVIMNSEMNSWTQKRILLIATLWIISQLLTQLDQLKYPLSFAPPTKNQKKKASSKSYWPFDRGSVFAIWHVLACISNSPSDRVTFLFAQQFIWRTNWFLICLTLTN